MTAERDSERRMQSLIIGPSWFQKSYQMTISWNSYVHGGCQLSDPRDIVYAHLGLANSTTRKAIPINYDKTVAQVFEDVTRFYITYNSARSVQTILSFVEHIPQEKRGKAYPSWVPNWSSEYQLGSSNRQSVPKDLVFFDR